MKIKDGKTTVKFHQLSTSQDLKKDGITYHLLMIEHPVLGKWDVSCKRNAQEIYPDAYPYDLVPQYKPNSRQIEWSRKHQDLIKQAFRYRGFSPYIAEVDDSLKKDSMKKYKIGNKIITADSATKALEIHKLLDSKVKDVRWDELERAIFNEYDGEPHSEIGYDNNLRGFSSRTDASKCADFLEKKFPSLDFNVVNHNGWEIWVKGNIRDSISDESIDELSEEEKKAIEDYRKAIEGTTDPKLLELFAHILKEETEHLEELQNAKEGEFEDSVNDSKIELDWASDDDPNKLARKYNCQVKRTGSANGYPVYLFTGDRNNLKRLSKEYGIDEDDFNAFVEDSVKDMPDLETNSGKQEMFLQQAMSALEGISPRKWNRSGYKINLDNNRITLVCRADGIIWKNMHGDNDMRFTNTAALKEALKKENL